MEVASLVLGVVALILGLSATPTILQMYFGRPWLTFEADEFSGSESKILVIAIKNRPISAWLLRAVGVERDAGDVLAFFDIQEQGTGKFLARSASGLLHCAPMREQGLLVRALPGFTVGLTVVDTRGGAAMIVDARSEQPIPINQGHYTAFVQVIRGQRIYKLRQDFRVGASDHQTIWDQRGVSLIR